MNTEICKNCEILFQITETDKGYTLMCCGKDNKHICFVEFMFYDRFKEILMNSEIVSTKIDVDTELRTRNIYFVKPKKRLEFLKDKEVNQFCLFNIEHKIYDLCK